MNKLLGFVLVVAVAVAGYFAINYFFNSCKIAPQQVVDIYQILCIQEFMQGEDTLDKVCNALNREKGCKLQPGDEAAVEAFARKTVEECAKKHLGAENYCTDKLGFSL